MTGQRRAHRPLRAADFGGDLGLAGAVADVPGLQPGAVLQHRDLAALTGGAGGDAVTGQRRAHRPLRAADFGGDLGLAGAVGDIPGLQPSAVLQHRERAAPPGGARLDAVTGQRRAHRRLRAADFGGDLGLAGTVADVPGLQPGAVLQHRERAAPPGGAGGDAVTGQRPGHRPGRAADFGGDLGLGGTVADVPGLQPSAVLQHRERAAPPGGARLDAVTGQRRAHRPLRAADFGGDLGLAGTVGDIPGLQPGAVLQHRDLAALTGGAGGDAVTGQRRAHRRLRAADFGGDLGLAGTVADVPGLQPGAVLQHRERAAPPGGAGGDAVTGQRPGHRPGRAADFGGDLGLGGTVGDIPGLQPGAVLQRRDLARHPTGRSCRHLELYGDRAVGVGEGDVVGAEISQLPHLDAVRGERVAHRGELGEPLRFGVVGADGFEVGEA